jgi:hypothetical protein
MLYAAAKGSSDGAEVRRALVALGFVGTMLLSYHLYVHDLSLLFLAIVLILELLLSNPQLSKGTKATLQGSIALLFCSPLYLVLTLRYGQLRLLTIVLLVFFAGVLSLISSRRAKTGEALLPQAWGGR